MQTNSINSSDYNVRAAKKAAERRAKMQALRDAGWTLDAIARRFGGISRQRVMTILRRAP